VQNPIVYIESPHAGAVYKHTLFLKRCIKDSIKRGEIPFASHLFYTQVLNDKIPEQRKQGIDLGDQIRLKCDYTVFYIDLGWSKGMVHGLVYCQNNGLARKERNLKTGVETILTNKRVNYGN
jgi:hypothetical protein